LLEQSGSSRIGPHESRGSDDDLDHRDRHQLERYGTVERTAPDNQIEAIAAAIPAARKSTLSSSRLESTERWRLS